MIQGKQLLMTSMAVAAVLVACEGSSQGPPDVSPVAVPCLVRDVTAGGAPATDLQQVIDTASTGSVIEVSGTCIGHFTINRAVTLRSAKGTPRATLDGNHSGRVLSVAGSSATPPTVTLRRLRLEHGRAETRGQLGGYGGAVLLVGADVRLIRSAIVDNYATEGGGGVYARRSELRVIRTTVVANQGGRHSDGGGIAALGSVLLVDAKVTGNRAARGGGLYARSATLSGQSVISRNTATAVGGGTWIIGSIRMTDASRVRRNTAGFGGGIYTSGTVGSVGIRMTDRAMIDHNVALGYHGGGAYANNAATIMSGRSSIHGNAVLKAYRTGAAGEIWSDSGGGIWISGVLKMRDQAVIARNWAAGDGGGVWSDHYQQGFGVIMRGASLVRANVARRGGGISIAESNALLADRAAVRDNTSTRTGGGIVTWSVQVKVRGEAEVSGNQPNNITDTAY